MLDETTSGLHGLWSNSDSEWVEWFCWYSVAAHEVGIHICLCVSIKNQVREPDNFLTLPETDLHMVGMLFCLRFWEV